MQVLLAAMQSQLLGDSRVANTLIPRVCNAVLAAPSSTRHVSRPSARVLQRPLFLCISTGLWLAFLCLSSSF